MLGGNEEVEGDNNSWAAVRRDICRGMELMLDAKKAIFISVKDLNVQQTSKLTGF